MAPKVRNSERNCPQTRNKIPEVRPRRRQRIFPHYRFLKVVVTLRSHVGWPQHVLWKERWLD